MIFPHYILTGSVHNSAFQALCDMVVSSQWRLRKNSATMKVESLELKSEAQDEWICANPALSGRILNNKGEACPFVAPAGETRDSFARKVAICWAAEFNVPMYWAGEASWKHIGFIDDKAS